MSRDRNWAGHTQHRLPFPTAPKPQSYAAMQIAAVALILDFWTLRKWNEGRRNEDGKEKGLTAATLAANAAVAYFRGGRNMGLPISIFVLLGNGNIKQIVPYGTDEYDTKEALIKLIESISQVTAELIGPPSTNHVEHSLAAALRIVRLTSSLALGSEEENVVRVVYVTSDHTSTLDQGTIETAESETDFRIFDSEDNIFRDARIISFNALRSANSSVGGTQACPTIRRLKLDVIRVREGQHQDLPTEKSDIQDSIKIEPDAKRARVADRLGKLVVSRIAHNISISICTVTELDLPTAFFNLCMIHHDLRALVIKSIPFTTANQAVRRSDGIFLLKNVSDGPVGIDDPTEVDLLQTFTSERECFTATIVKKKVTAEDIAKFPRNEVSGIFGFNGATTVPANGSLVMSWFNPNRLRVFEDLVTGEVGDIIVDAVVKGQSLFLANQKHSFEIDRLMAAHALHPFDGRVYMCSLAAPISNKTHGGNLGLLSSVQKALEPLMEGKNVKIREQSDAISSSFQNLAAIYPDTPLVPGGISPKVFKLCLKELEVFGEFARSNASIILLAISDLQCREAAYAAILRSTLFVTFQWRQTSLQHQQIYQKAQDVAFPILYPRTPNGTSNIGLFTAPPAKSDSETTTERVDQSQDIWAQLDRMDKMTYNEQQELASGGGPPTIPRVGSTRKSWSRTDEDSVGDSRPPPPRHIVSYLKVDPPDPYTQWISEAASEHRSIMSSSEHTGSGSADVEYVFRWWYGDRGVKKDRTDFDGDRGVKKDRSDFDGRREGMNYADAGGSMASTPGGKRKGAYTSAPLPIDIG